MRTPKKVKLFLTLIIISAVIFCSSYFGAQAFGKRKNTNPAQSASVKVTQKPAGNPVHIEREDVINQSTVRLQKVPEDLQAALTVISKIELPAQTSFSFLQIVKKQDLGTLSTDTLNILATAIYQTILPTNFAIEERNISNELPAYAPLGEEARVDSAQNMDLAFFNPNKTACRLDLQLNGDSLAVTLKGPKLPYEYKITTRNEQKLMQKTVVQYSPLLSPGQTIVKNAGHHGQTAMVYREVYQEGWSVKREFISNDYYAPTYRVELHALNAPAVQPGTGADSNTQAGQPASANTQQTGQQTGAANVTAPQSNNDSDLWGKPNEQVK